MSEQNSTEQRLEAQLSLVPTSLLVRELEARCADLIVLGRLKGYHEESPQTYVITTTGELPLLIGLLETKALELKHQLADSFEPEDV